MRILRARVARPERAQELTSSATPDIVWYYDVASQFYGLVLPIK